MSNDDFHKSTDGIARPPRNRSEAMNIEQEPPSKNASVFSRKSRWIWISLITYSVIIVFTGVYYFLIENQRQQACERFLAYQSNYALYLTDVDDFITRVAQGTYDASSAAAPENSDSPSPFSSSSALTIELSDPFGVSPQATRLSEALRAVSRRGGFEFKSDREAWIKDTVARRDQFVLSVQEANPCIENPGQPLSLM